MKLFINPQLSQTKDDNGIGRVVHAQYRLLPALGFELVSDFRHADLIASHVMGEGLPHLEVLHGHGTYWSDTPHIPFSNVNHEANRRIAAAARRSLAITVPSEWVSMIYRRDLRITPTVIGHGIEPELWQTDKKRKEPYLLWNKTRADDVCDPTPAWELAKRGAPVISTVLPKDKPPVNNYTVTGVMSHAEMKRLIEGASIYLATTMETFGIGTLEALAAGTPVLGYAWGGTKDIVRHKVDGWLAEPNDLDGLVEGLQYILDHWQEMAHAARQRAEMYTWPAIMEQYAALYRHVGGEVKAESDRVSIVITNKDYGRWIGEAIESATNQLQEDDELIIIDDGSTDNSREVISNIWHGSVSSISFQNEKGTRIRYEFTENHGVAHARNLGISLANNPFIGCLDADDKYHPGFLRAVRPVLASDRGIGVAYVGLEFFDETGEIVRTWNPPAKFDWEYQTRPTTKPDEPPSTVIPTPSACLFRKAMWTRAGGYQQVYAPGEDTEFMVRGLSVGFTAQPVQTDARTRYRLHPNGASRTKKYIPIDTWHPWMRDKQYPFAAPYEGIPVANSYALPLVSVIMPVAEKHLQYLPSALDSLLGQTFRNWEVLVITDNCELPEKVKTVYPFIRHYTSKGKGVSEARNTGLDHADAPLVLFLDADDWLEPHAISQLVLKYSQNEGRYVYPDARGIYADGKLENIQFLEYDPQSYFQVNLHSVTALMATAQARALQFSPFMRGFEDWDFYLRAAIAGYHGVRLAEPLVNIRRDTGHFQAVETEERRKYKDEYIKKHYQAYQTGEKPMAGCCGGGGDALLKAKNAMTGQMNKVETVTGNEMVRMEYAGNKIGAFTININGKAYRMSAAPLHRIFDARPGDVQKLLMTVEGLRVVRSPHSAAAPPAMPPSSPVPFNFSGIEKQAHTVSEKVEVSPRYDPVKETAHQAPALPILDKPPRVEIAPVFQDDYAVKDMTISDVKTAIERGVEPPVLFGWLTAEQTSEKPRAGVISAIEKALER